MLEPVPDAAESRPVGDERGERGRVITERRQALGLSVRAFAREAGKSREAVTAAEGGQASLRTYVELEACLDELEGSAPGPDESGDITVEVHGPATRWSVTFTGPLGAADELGRAALDILKESGALEPDAD